MFLVRPFAFVLGRPRFHISGSRFSQIRTEDQAVMQLHTKLLRNCTTATANVAETTWLIRSAARLGQSGPGRAGSRARWTRLGGGASSLKSTVGGKAGARECEEDIWSLSALAVSPSPLSALAVSPPALPFPRRDTRTATTHKLCKTPLPVRPPPGVRTAERACTYLRQFFNSDNTLAPHRPYHAKLNDSIVSLCGN